MQTGDVKRIKGGKTENLGAAPSEPQKDWVVLLKKK
jgi:hypothetical protein